MKKILVLFLFVSFSAFGMTMSNFSDLFNSKKEKPIEKIQEYQDISTIDGTYDSSLEKEGKGFVFQKKYFSNDFIIGGFKTDQKLILLSDKDNQTCLTETRGVYKYKDDVIEDLLITSVLNDQCKTFSFSIGYFTETDIKYQKYKFDKISSEEKLNFDKIGRKELKDIFWEPHYKVSGIKINFPFSFYVIGYGDMHPSIIFLKDKIIKDKMVKKVLSNFSIDNRYFIYTHEFLPETGFNCFRVYEIKEDNTKLIAEDCSNST